MNMFDILPSNIIKKLLSFLSKDEFETKLFYMPIFWKYIDHISIQYIRSQYPIESVIKEATDFSSERVLKLCNNKNNEKCVILKELKFNYNTTTNEKLIQEGINNEYIKQLIDTSKISNVFSKPLFIENNKIGIYIVSEFSKGETLSYMLQNKLLSVQQLHYILEKLARAISQLENNKSQHLDFHSDNIIIEMIDDNIINIGIIDYGTMFIPNVGLIGKNIEFIIKYPYNYAKGYAMYTLIKNLLFTTLVQDLDNQDRGDTYNYNPCSVDIYNIIYKYYPEYAKYLYIILEDNGFAFSGDECTSSFSAITIDFKPPNLKELQNIEISNIKKYSGENISKYLSQHSIIDKKF